MVNLKHMLITSLAVAGLNSALAQEEELPSNLFSIKYMGEYARVILHSGKGETYFNRKLVTHQAISLPTTDSSGRAIKKLSVQLGKRNMVINLRCSKRQMAKQLGSDVFEFGDARKAVKKAPCFVQDKVIEKATVTGATVIKAPNS